MGKFDGVLLVSDFDDTLYDASHRVPPRNVEAIEYFVAQGGRFTVATGRAHRTFAPYVSLAPINAPVILSNGAGIYDFQADRALVETLLPLEAPQELGAVIDQFPDLGMEAYHGEDIYVWNPNAITYDHLKKVGCDFTRCAVDEMPTPWVKALFHQEHDLLLQAQRFLLEHWGDRYEAIFSNLYYLEITRKGSTKGGMVQKLAQLLRIQPQNIYCVGDNQNDIPMLELSAVPFAPADCARQVKDWGAELLCPCEEGVIGDIVERLEERY
jgi:Cof subfamily protein (haloacid dehalogenase superfamily)